MLTIEPPASCCCIQWLARCEQKIAANRLSATIRSVKRGFAVVVSAGGDPPALFTSTSRRPSRSTTVVDHRPRGLAVAEIDAEPRPPVGQVLGFAAGAHGDGRAGVGEALCDPPPHALGTAGHEHDHAVEIELDGHRGTVPRMVEVKIDGPVTRIALDRPDRRNALSLDTMREFVARGRRPRRLVLRCSSSRSRTGPRSPPATTSPRWSGATTPSTTSCSTSAPR